MLKEKGREEKMMRVRDRKKWDLKGERNRSRRGRKGGKCIRKGCWKKRMPRWRKKEEERKRER